MHKQLLFTDGSVHVQSQVGYGAYLVVPEPDLSLSELKPMVKVRRFEQTSSTKLELQTLLWALSDVELTAHKLIVYTDSQNLIGLPGRRERLEQKGYRSNKNTLLNNYELYQEFYSIIDQLDCKLVKVRGHQAADQKDNMDRLFTLVDKAARKALRGEGEQRDH